MNKNHTMQRSHEWQVARKGITPIELATRKQFYANHGAMLNCTWGGFSGLSGSLRSPSAFVLVDGPSLCLAVLCFYSKTVFWSLYCQISTNLDKILHTPIVVRNTLVGRLRPRSARLRRVSSGQTRTTVFFSVILVMHPKSYIETMDRRYFVGKPSEWRWGRVLLWKNPEFYSVGVARSKIQHFSRFRVPFDYPAHSLQETVLPQTNGTNGKPRLKVCLLLV